MRFFSNFISFFSIFKIYNFYLLELEETERNYMSFVITGVTDLAKASEKFWAFSHSLLCFVFLVQFCRQEKCLLPSSMIFRPERRTECFGNFPVKRFCFSNLAIKFLGFSWD